jgi:internalin A
VSKTVGQTRILPILYPADSPDVIRVVPPENSAACGKIRHSSFTLVRRFLVTLRLPHWKWLLYVAIPFVLAAVALPFAIPVYQKHVAIREIERLKGIVTTTKGGPEWLREWLGDEQGRMFDDVTGVNLAMTEITDDGLRHVAVFKTLVNLNLARTKVTDAGIENLKGLTTLDRLSLQDTEITDAGLGHLKSLESLRLLFLDKTKVTHAGVKDLQAALPKLVIETRRRQFSNALRAGGGFF